MSAKKGAGIIPHARLTFEQTAFLAHKEFAALEKSWFVLAGSEDFRILLPKLNLDKEGDEVFILIKPYIHTMGIYMRVMNHKVKCFIADSQGWHWRYYPTRNLVAALDEQFGSRAEIFLPQTALQHQEIQTGCDVFSIIYLEYCGRKGELFFQELENHIAPEEETKEFNGAIGDSGLNARSKISLLKKNSLPPSFCEALQQKLSQKNNVLDFWLQKTMTVNPHLVAIEYANYLQDAKDVNVSNEESWSVLQEWQHLSPDDLFPDVEHAPLYRLEIIRNEKKYSLKINFEKAKIGKDQFMYGDCLTFSAVDYPKDVSVNQLQTIFGEVAVVTMNEQENSLTVHVSTKEELSALIDQLSSKDYQLGLYQRGMYQHLALAHFTFEARELYQMLERKKPASGGLFLGEVNAALQYFIESCGKHHVGVVQEIQGIKNPNLLGSIVGLLTEGKEKIVFACDVLGVTHQVAVIIDKSKKQIRVIDSEGNGQGAKEIESLFRKNPYFDTYQFLCPTPIVLQDEDKWACGVHAILNILDELGEIPDRKHVDMDGWLRKILRASRVTESTNLQRQNKNIVRNNLIDTLSALCQDSTKSGLMLSSLLGFLNTFVKSSSASSLNELKNCEQYKGIKLDKYENEVLAIIYSLVELDCDKKAAKEIITRCLSFINEPEAAETYIEFKVPRTNSNLIDQVSYIIEENIREKTDQIGTIPGKKAKLSNLYYALIFQEIDIKDVIPSDSLSQLINWIREQGNQPYISNASLSKWLNYLLLNKLKNMVIELVETEKSARRQAKIQKKSNTEKQKREVENHLEKIEEALGADAANAHKEILQWIGQLNRKIFKLPPDGWAELITNIKPDKDLLAAIITDYETSDYSNFFISALKTLHDQHNENEAIALSKSSYVQKFIEQDFRLIEVGLLLPKRYQSQFFTENIPTINDYLTRIGISLGKSVSPIVATTLTSAKLVQHVATILEQEDFDSCIVVLTQLPANFNLYLLDAVKQKINKGRQLAQVLLTLPENERFSIAKQYKKLVAGKYLADVVSVLPRDKRYLFVEGFLNSVTNLGFFNKNRDFPNVLICLTVPEVEKTLQKYSYFLRNGYVLAKIIKNLPEHLSRVLAEKYVACIKDGVQLFKVTKYLPEEFRFIFIKANGNLISTVEEIALLVQFVPEEVKVDFIEQYLNRAFNSSELALLAAAMPKNKGWDFVKQHMDLIVNGCDIAKIIKFAPSHLRMAFILEKIDIIQDGLELYEVIKECALDEALTLVNAYKKPLEEETAKTLGKILQCIPGDHRFQFALDHSAHLSRINDLHFFVCTLREEERFRFLKAHAQKNGSPDYQSGKKIANILFILPVRERIPFMDYLLDAGIVKQLFKKSKLQPLDILMSLHNSSDDETISSEEIKKLKKKLDTAMGATYAEEFNYRFYSVKTTDKLGDGDDKTLTTQGNSLN